MIRTEKGIVEMRGGEPFILADFACIVQAVYESFAERYGSEKAIDLVLMCIKDALVGGE